MIVKEKKSQKNSIVVTIINKKKEPCSLETSSFALDTGDIKSPLGR